VFSPTRSGRMIAHVARIVETWADANRPRFH
jgi:hypothetical protein